MPDKNIVYAPCKDIKRGTPDFNVDKELAKKIGQDFRTLPILQKSLYEAALKKHYSLETNELLKCRWNQYKRNIEGRVFAPFKFLDIRDYHFYNCRNQLIPSQSVHTRTFHRKTFRPGPGIDQYGRLPTPNEMLMKRKGPSRPSKVEKAKRPQ